MQNNRQTRQSNCAGTTRLSLCMETGMHFMGNLVNAGISSVTYRSEDFQSAVSPICNRLPVRSTRGPREIRTRGGMQFRDTADYKSALRHRVSAQVYLATTLCA